MSEEQPDVYKPSRWGEIFHGLTDHGAPIDELLGAGSAGPGKSWVLLMDPMAQVTVEHERCANARHRHPLAWGSSTGWALHLRRTRPMLDQTIARSKKVFPLIDSGAEWNENKTTWAFSSGYKYQFGHCKDPGDWDQYMSNEYTWIGFDELTQFEEEQYDQIITRKRSGDPVLSLMLKVRACSNPLMKKEASENFTVKDPNWVRRRFVDPDRRGKVVLKRKMVRSDGTVFYKRMMYLPATLADNPDPAFRLQYEETLLNAPAHIRQALLFGDWYVTAGSFFAEYWNEKLHVCRPFRAPSDWRFFRSMDWGFKAPGVIYWWALDDDESLYCIKELTFQGKTDAEVATIVKEVEIGLDLWDKKSDRSRITGPADTQLWEKRGDSGKSKYEVFRDLGIPWVQASKSRQANAQYIIKRLVDHDNGTKIPGVVFFSSCKEALKTIPGIQTSGKNTEEPQDGGPDHWYDAIAYAHAYASRGKQGIPRMLDLRDEWDDSDEANMKLKRGRDGYGRN